MKIRRALIVVVSLAILGCAVLSRNAFLNAWGLLTGRGYIVPQESSLFTFRPTVMNEGSGEWWLYGEDARFYYHFTGQAGKAYAKIARSSAVACKNFNPRDYSTWCKGADNIGNVSR